jgi:outer membrane protein assembly factor BamB
MLAVVATTGVSASLHGNDWPQWLGPDGDNQWRESGILRTFPAEGPPVKWRAAVHWGYAGPAVAGGRVFVMDFLPDDPQLRNNPSGREQVAGTERVLCLSSADGSLLWEHAAQRTYAISYPGGPRCTPAVDAEHVYALGAQGHLTCLRRGDGHVVWSKDFVADYGAPTPVWGFAAHPLADDQRLYCVVGGKDAAVVAFDKATGRELWRALATNDAGYCPPTLIRHAGVEQLIIWLPETLAALNPATGATYWTLPLKPAYGMSIAAPRKHGDVLFASGHGHTAAAVRLGEGPTDVEVVWSGKAGRGVYASNATPYLEDGVIYGSDCFSGGLAAARLEDGQELWTVFEPTTGDRRAAHGTAFLFKHEDRFLLMSETGHLILAKLSPAGYEEISRAKILEPTNEAFGRPVVWSSPALAEKCVFARNDKELVCVDLSAR